MKCLSIKPEYVLQILSGEKKVEYRSWSTNYRGDIFVACTATKTANGYIAGVVEVKDVVYDENDGCYHWLLENPRAIVPIPIKGQQRLFETNIDKYVEVDDDTIDAAYDEAVKWILK